MHNQKFQKVPWLLFQVHEVCPNTSVDCKIFWKEKYSGTGNFFSEALIFASFNPQYGKRLFIQFTKKHSLEHVVYKKCFFVFVLTFKTIFVHNMFWTCILGGIQWTIACNVVG